MADVPGTSGIPDVAPQVSTPGDYLTVQANPAEFGGEIAQGLEKFGAGASTAGKFFGEVQTDAAVNDAMDQAHDIVAKFQSLNGADALNAQESTKANMDAAFAEGRKGLYTPEQELQYDQITRNYRERYLAGLIETHANQQAKIYATQTNNDSFRVALNVVANTADNPEQMQAGIHDARRALVQQLQVDGTENDPEAVKAAVAKADQASYKTAAETLAVRDPAKALALVESHRDELGIEYAPLYDRLKSSVLTQNANTIATQAVTDVTGTTGPAGTATAIPADYKARVAQIESPTGTPNAQTAAFSQYQFLPATGAALGVSPQSKPEEIDAAMDRFTAQNKAALTSSLGRQPTSDELYVAHVEGAAGAAALFKNPDVPAVTALAPAYGGDVARATQAVTLNGGTPDMSSAAFAQSLQQRYTGTAAARAFRADTGAAEAEAIRRGMDAAGNDPQLQQRVQAQIKEHFQSVRMDAMAAQAQAQAASDAAAKGYTSQILDPSFGTDSKVVTSVISQAAHDPALNWQTQRDIVNMAEAHLIKDTGKDTQTYGPGFWQAFQSIHSPDGTPGRITDPQQLYARGGPDGDLTVAGIEKLRQEIEGKKTAEGQAEATMKDQFLRTARGRITGTDEGLHLKDPKGDELYLKFLAQALPAYDAGKAKGLTPSQMLNPDSKDYIGQIIPNFARPQSQWFTDMTQGNAPTNEVDLKSPQGIIAAYHDGKITKEDAENAAIAGGWLAKPAPTVPVAH